METNNIKYKKSESLSTDSVYYRFWDDKGRDALIRLSDHDASFFRRQADFDLPMSASIEQIVRMGESAVENKQIPVIAFIGDKIAGNKIDRVMHGGKYGSSIYLSGKDTIIIPLHDFEKRYGLKVKDRTRQEEKTKLKYRMLFEQLEDKALFIHNGEIQEFTKINIPTKVISFKENKHKEVKDNNYPAFISARYYEKKAIPFSENEILNNHKKFSDERFMVFYISKEEEGKYTPDYVDFYKTTHALIPYINYLIENNLLVEPKDSDIILPKLYKEPDYDKKLRLKWDEHDRIAKLINSKTNGLVKQYGFEDFKVRFKDRYDISEIEKLLNEKDSVYKEIQELGKNKPNMKLGGAIENNHSSLGCATKLGIPTIVSAHDTISKCADCGYKFSYQNSKSNILWECPYCLSKKHIS